MQLFLVALWTCFIKNPKTADISFSDGWICDRIVKLKSPTIWKSQNFIRNILIKWLERQKVFWRSWYTDYSVLTHSRNPKTPQIRSFFCEKWLLFGVLRVPKSSFFMQAWNAWPFDACIIIYQIARKVSKIKYFKFNQQALTILLWYS